MPPPSPSLPFKTHKCYERRGGEVYRDFLFTIMGLNFNSIIFIRGKVSNLAIRSENGKKIAEFSVGTEKSFRENEVKEYSVTFVETRKGDIYQIKENFPIEVVGTPYLEKTHDNNGDESDRINILAHTFTTYPFPGGDSIPDREKAYYHWFLMARKIYRKECTEGIVKNLSAFVPIPEVDFTEELACNIVEIKPVYTDIDGTEWDIVGIKNEGTAEDPKLMFRTINDKKESVLRPDVCLSLDELTDAAYCFREVIAYRERLQESQEEEI